MDVKLLLPNLGSHWLGVYTSDTVRSLKGQVAELVAELMGKGYDYEDLCLVLRGRVLSDDAATVEEYGIVHETSLVVLYCEPVLQPTVPVKPLKIGELGLEHPEQANQKQLEQKQPEKAAEQKVGPAAEVSRTQSMASRLRGFPKFSGGNGYYTEPPIEVLRGWEDEQLREVHCFSVGKVGVGKVQWEELTDIRGLDLDVVHFQPREVEVYPAGTQAPPLGKGLNKPAIITLEGVLPPAGASQEQVWKFEERVVRRTAKMGALLLEYNSSSGLWRFKVEHFG